MNILLTNDDGYSAPGIQALKKFLKEKGHNVFLVAPEKGQSAKSQAITILEPIRAKKIIYNNDECWAVNGFPTDCVFMGVLELYKDVKIDLLISGINNGANVGYDVNYSGTIGAAREALTYNIPCIATSLFTHDPKADFSFACKYTYELVEKLSKFGFRTDCLYNLNVPYTNDVKGLVVTNMSDVVYFNGIEKRTDPYGIDYYFITGNYNWELKEGTDADYLYKNYATLTSIKIDYTYIEENNRLKEIFRG